MAYSFVQYTGDGAINNYAVTFGYLAKAHVEVRIGGVLKTVTTDYTWPTSTTIRPVVAVPNGTIIELRRNTPKTTAFVDFTDASTLTEENLDNSTIQALYIVQEAFDAADLSIQLDSQNRWDAESRRIINVANPTSAQDAVTRAYLDSALTQAGNLPTQSGNDNKFLRVVSGAAAWVTFTMSMISDATAFGLSLLAAANAAAARALLVVADAVHTHAAADIASGTIATARLGGGSASASTFLRGDQAWAAVTGAVTGIKGLTLSNNGTDPTNDIDIAAGACMSDDADPADRVVMYLSSAITKQLDAAWAVGNNQGGRSSAAAIENTTYHVFAVKRTDTGVVDVILDVSATAPTMPTNYTKKQRIGSIMRESAAIVLFTQDEDFFERTTPSFDVDAASPGTSAVTRTLSVPIGISVHAFVNASTLDGNGGPNQWYLSDLAVTDQAASGTANPLATVITQSNVNNAVQARIRTNTSAQIRSRLQAAAGGTVRISTLGWFDYKRGRN